jgi:hypothetical protein
MRGPLLRHLLVVVKFPLNKIRYRKREGVFGLVLIVKKILA